MKSSTDVSRQSRYQSMSPSRIKLSNSRIYQKRSINRSSITTSKQYQQQQQIHQIAATILQRRDRLRIFYEGEDLTPRFLIHPQFAGLSDKRTAFDILSLAQLSASQSGSVAQTQGRASYATMSPSTSSIYTLDDILIARQNESFVTTTKDSLKDSVKAFDVVEDTVDVPSQFRLPRFESMKFTSPNDKVTIVLKETETFFLFDMPQLTEDATTEQGQLLIQENERYKRILVMVERKTISAETQTPLLYTKTRSTCIGRKERKNCATIVNNWVMYDTFNNDQVEVADNSKDSRFMFREPKPEELHGNPNDQLEEIGSKLEYENASRVTLRILASKFYGEAQKRFVGILHQDSYDPNLQLVYGLDLLWQHQNELLDGRRVSAVHWNPANDALMAVGYTNLLKKQNNEDEAPEGIVAIWCAKSPTNPDRFYKFNSPVSDLDWNRSEPNLLAVGFYDGIVRVIDVSKKKLTVIRLSNRKSVPCYEPHWRVLWWPVSSASFETESHGEQLYTCNQDGRIFSFTSDQQFEGREILRLWRTEGKAAGIESYNQCVNVDVPIVQSTGVLLLRNHPGQPGIYLVGTEEGYVHRCSTSHHRGHLDTFRAHNGPIYELQFSPFYEKFLITCGGDWYIRIWCDGLNIPLLSFTTTMSCVTSVCWSPRNSTIFASAVDNEICIWDIRRKTYRPASVTRLHQDTIIQRIEFTRKGEQIVVGDNDGKIYVYGTLGIPLPPFDQAQTLIGAIEKSLLIKPEVLKRFRKVDLQI